MWVFIGFRAAGKSTLCRALASRFSLRVFSTDSEVERLSGCSIQQLVKEKGWDYFRDLECRVLLTALNGEYDLIDTGGGIVESRANQELLKNCACLYLQVDWSELKRRLTKDESRPLLLETNEEQAIFQRREKIYRRLASHTQSNQRLTSGSGLSFLSL